MTITPDEINLETPEILQESYEHRTTGTTSEAEMDEFSDRVVNVLIRLGYGTKLQSEDDESEAAYEKVDHALWMADLAHQMADLDRSERMAVVAMADRIRFQREVANDTGAVIA